MKRYLVTYRTKWWFMPLQIFLLGQPNRKQCSIIQAHDFKEMKRKFKRSEGCCIQPIGMCKLLKWEELP